MVAIIAEAFCMTGPDKHRNSKGSLIGKLGFMRFSWKLIVNGRIATSLVDLDCQKRSEE